MNVSFDQVPNDNPEDESLETMRITMNLTSREAEVLNQLRGGRTVIEYVKERLPFECSPEYIEQILHDQRDGDEFERQEMAARQAENAS